jgi:hypothetical protein
MTAGGDRWRRGSGTLTGAIVLVIVFAAAVVAVCPLGRRVSVPELVQPTND